MVGARVPVQYIPIPESRVTEFFEMFGHWIGDSGSSREEQHDQVPEVALSSWRDGPEDQRLGATAEHVYAHVSPAARAILDFWLDHPTRP